MKSLSDLKIEYQMEDSEKAEINMLREYGRDGFYRLTKQYTW